MSPVVLGAAALLTSSDVEGRIVPIPILPLGATRKRDVATDHEVDDRSTGARSGDVVDAVFVRGVVEALELCQRAVLVVEQHAGVRGGGVAEILDGVAGQRRRWCW